MSAHTPGPWWFAADAPDTYAVGHGDIQIAGGLRRDNARLIAAAPDLLAALRAVYAAERSCVNIAGDVRERAMVYAGALAAISATCRAALAKAEGR